MTRYLLDTNIISISELRKKNRCNLGVKNWYATINEQEIYLSVLVIGESHFWLLCHNTRVQLKRSPSQKILKYTWA